MNVYGQLSGTLTPSGLLHGTLVGDHYKIQGVLTIPTVVDAQPYTGAYEVTPKAWEEQILRTEGKLMADDVTVFRVPYYETSNLYNGLTVFIAEDSNG